ncbi:MAG TPA: TonB-dependent receptor [Saprospiraceae bacterium]|nr:TonB-dependent receptor [Saprospiraceae bacterium]HMP25682.1 TonB-dependent receptor [Saprospiraceae bacterium]
MTRLLLCCLFLIVAAAAVAQTSLNGKVTDEETGEPIIFGNVVLFRNGVFIAGVETDFDGNFNFSNIDPGTYDIEVSYVGYQPQRLTAIQVLAGKANRADVVLDPGTGVTLSEVVIREYKVPLIEQDNTTSGGVITSEQIRNLPTRNINALAATTAGLSSADEGGAITIRGSRSNATDYYVDGIRVQGNLIPESEIEQLQVITGGVEAQYGDVTGGIISITTKGPSNKFSGGVEIESSNLTDAYNNSLVGFNLTGPLMRNARGESILGFRLSGRLTDQLDGNPPATPVFRVKDEVLQRLEANPIIDIGGNPFVAADFLTNDDVDVLKARPFSGFRRYDLLARLDARLSRAVDLSFTGSYADSKNQFTPGGWRVYNSHNNPFSLGQTYRGIVRLRHRLGGAGGGSATAKRSSIIQNAAYTLQFSYEKTQSELADPRHGDRLFDYGHVGNFDIEWIPTFVQLFDPATGQAYLEHTDYRQVLRGYTPGAANPVLANYNNAMGIDFNGGERLNGQIGNFLITNAGATPNALARTAFIAPNGVISGIFTNSWNFHTNVGTVYNLFQQGDNDIYTFNATTSFDLVPGGSASKGRHSIQMGIWYEQRINRAYTVSPRGLWDIARQQANIHIQGIPENADTIGMIDVGDFGSTPLLGLSIAPGEDSRFFRRIRDVTGQSLTDFVNVDGLSPDLLSLDLFSAKELNDQQIINYFGYDYLGNPFNGTFDEFFTATDADGIRTFPVAPNRPVYTAAYIQDKFTFKDIIFRLGVRVDRYDANTRVLKDNYSLYEIMNANDFHAMNGDDRPGNIGDDFKVYVNDVGTSVTAYRNGDDWFAANGTPVNNPATLFSGGLVFPKYADERVERDQNFIKSRDFDPNVSFRDYEVQVNIMPRLAFSFPISTEANFFAHYDILVQRPPSNTLATPRDYFYFTDISYGPNNPINNPNLRPERTIDYEVGFRQRVSNSSAIKIAAYYKELRDMIQIRTFFPVPNVIQYTTYDNQDFATVKGFTFEYDLRRTGNVSLLANYTLQFADGTGSDANSQRGLTSRGNLRTLFPVNYDERHRFNVIMDYRYGSGRLYNGPRVFGSDIFANAGFNLQGVMVSGRPYTAAQTPTELGGVGTIGSINGARKPWNFTLNIRVDKNFTINNKLGMNVYCRVSNLLDRRNVLNVYPVTGSATDDGFLASSFGDQQIRNIQNSVRDLDAYLASYQWALLNPGLFSLPRRIFLGAIMDF